MKEFEKAHSILAQTGHSIFPAHPRKYRIGQNIVAIRADERTRSFFLLRHYHDKFFLGWAQPGVCDDEVKKELAELLGKKLKLRPRLINFIRRENLHDIVELIAPPQQEEFYILLKESLP